MILSQHWNFYLGYLVDRKKNKDFHPLTHLFAETCLNPSNAEGFTVFEFDKVMINGYNSIPQGTWNIYIGKLIEKQV